MEPDPLGAFIRERRIQLDLSQRELAERAGISHSYIANLERGFDYSTGRRNRPTVEKLEQIARGLGVPADQLLRLSMQRRGSLVPTPDEPRYPPTPSEQSIMRLAEEEGIVFPFDAPGFWTRSPHERRHTFRYLEGLIDEARESRPENR